MTAHSVLILGTDAFLAAAPATPVQLMHACQSAGYDVVVPGSWGDELIAARAIERVQRVEGPVVQCNCPLVGARLAEAGESIGQLLVCLVPPPVATAQYVRALYAPATIQVTYVGECPAAGSSGIDVWMSPDRFLAWLDARGIHPIEQPTEFDSVIPPDRRRFYSEPGGIPSRQALRQGGGIDLIEIREDDVAVDLAQHLLQKGRALIDVALPMDCVCSGRVAGVGADAARARVRELEPPRAPSPVVDHRTHLALDVAGPGPLAEHTTSHRQTALPPPARREFDQVAELPSVAVPTAATQSESIEVGDMRQQRKSPPGIPRPVLGAMPLARNSGRQLPRAYVARRRSSPPSMRRIDPPAPQSLEPTLLPQQPNSAPAEERRQWAIVATIGVVVGLVIAWLIRLLP